MTEEKIINFERGKIKMTKIKGLVLLFLIAILVFVLPNIVSAATIEATETTTTSTGKTVSWSYELDSSDNIVNLKCTNVSDISGELTIPSTIDGYTVLTIGNTANNYTSIYEGAFEGCYGLTGITIPNTVTTIGCEAFSGCTGLKTITIPDSVTEIGNYAFYGCTGLKTITIPDSVTEIGSYAFSGCTGLTTLTIPDSVTTMGEKAFYGCTGLTSVTLSENLTKIDQGTFANCTGLTSVIIPENVTTILGGWSFTSDGAFDDCTNLEKILIPDSVATIGENVFYNCSKLTIYGNDGQASKTYAEDNNINFKYISEWDEVDVGDDITAPTVESIQVPYSNVAGYYDSNSTTYIIPAGKALIINVNFSEAITATSVPTLTIKFGSGSNIKLTNGSVSGSTIAYTYTVTSSDVGTLTAVSLSGGNVTDEAGNEAVLSCSTIKVSLYNRYVYANGTAVDVEDNSGSSSSNSGSTSSGSNSSSSSSSSSSGSGSSSSSSSDTTTASGKLPQTGINSGIVIVIAVIAIAGIVAFIQYRKLREV